MEVGGINKYKNKIFNIAIIILGLIIAINIYKNQIKDIDSLKQTKGMEDKKNAVLGNISQWEKKSKAYSNFLAKRDPGSAVNALNDLAKESGARIISIKPMPEQTYPDYTKLPFELVLGIDSYHALGNFISKIESYQDIYVIEAIEIKSETETKELRANLKLSSIAFTN